MYILPTHAVWHWAASARSWVRRDAPVSQKLLVLEPHLGDLTEAHGTTVTELGLVPVSWTQASHQIRFTFTVPPGVQAVLRLPLKPAQTVNIDGRAWPAEVKGTRLEVRVPPRSHEGWD